MYEKYIYKVNINIFNECVLRIGDNFTVLKLYTFTIIKGQLIMKI